MNQTPVDLVQPREADCPFNIEAVRHELSRNGLDMVHPMSTCWYNDERTRMIAAAATEGNRSPMAGLKPLLHFGRDEYGGGDVVVGRGKSCLALIIGNTRAIWKPFGNWLCDDPERVTDASPLDRYVQEVVERTLPSSSSSSSPNRQIFWAWEMSND